MGSIYGVVWPLWWAKRVLEWSLKRSRSTCGQVKPSWDTVSFWFTVKTWSHFKKKTHLPRKSQQADTDPGAVKKLELYGTVTIVPVSCEHPSQKDGSWGNFGSWKVVEPWNFDRESTQVGLTLNRFETTSMAYMFIWLSTSVNVYNIVQPCIELWFACAGNGRFGQHILQSEQVNNSNIVPLSTMAKSMV